MRRRSVALVLIALIALKIGTGRARAQTAGITRSFRAGWNLVSLTPGADSSAIEALYTLQPGDDGYETLPTGQESVAGYGYWALFTGNATISLAAGSDAPYQVSAPPGQFIMIGDPSGTAPATVSGADAVYVYDPLNGYQQTTTLLQGQGAWAISEQGGTITVTPKAAASSGIATASLNTAPVAPVEAAPAFPALSPSVAAALSPSGAAAFALFSGPPHAPASMTPAADDPRFLLVTSALGYQFEMPADWTQTSPPTLHDGSVLAQLEDPIAQIDEIFLAPNNVQVVSVIKVPALPGHSALQMLTESVQEEQSRSEQHTGTMTGVQIVTPPQAISVPGAEAAATAVDTGTYSLTGARLRDTYIYASRGAYMYVYTLIQSADRLPADALTPYGFQIGP